MEDIFCGYYDEEIEQDVPMQPNLDEAILFFKNFVWKNQESESGLKLLILQTPNNAALHISSSEDNTWCVSANVTQRRRYCGPFFKKETFHLFIDISEQETQDIIRLFYENTLSEFAEFLKQST